MGNVKLYWPFNLVNQFNVVNITYSSIPAWAELGPAQPQLVCLFVCLFVRDFVGSWGAYAPKNTKDWPHSYFTLLYLYFLYLICILYRYQVSVSGIVQFLKSFYCMWNMQTDRHTESRRVNCGVSWEPSSHKLSEMAEIIGWFETFYNF